MTLPSICESNEELRIQYLFLIKHMAKIDGHFDIDEITLLEKMASRFGISKSRYKEIFEEKDFSEQQVRSAFQNLKKDNLHYSFILDLITMAAVDGVILDAEKVMLSRIADLAGLNNYEFYNLINFVRVTSRINEGRKIDSIFQYVIDSFFEWVRKRKIVIFRETTLALNQKIDAQLKHDLPYS